MTFCIPSDQSGDQLSPYRDIQSAKRPIRQQHYYFILTTMTTTLTTTALITCGILYLSWWCIKMNPLDVFCLLNCDFLGQSSYI